MSALTRSSQSLLRRVAASGPGFVLLALGLMALWPSLFTSVDPSALNPENLLAAPRLGSGSWLGTDEIGRDLWARTVHGARVSLGIGLLSVICAVVLGGMLGLWAVHFGGWVELGIVRAMDFLLAIPNILLAIIIVAIMGPGLGPTILAVTFVAVPGMTLVFRGSLKAELARSYSEAARAMGLSPWQIYGRHILPNMLGPLMVQSSLGFSDAILNAAALGFLGLGVQPPQPEWGVMLADARALIDSAWWVMLPPGLCLLLSSLSFHLLGDHLRDSMDPKLRGRVACSSTD